MCRGEPSPFPSQCCRETLQCPSQRDEGFRRFLRQLLHPFPIWLGFVEVMNDMAEATEFIQSLMQRRIQHGGTQTFLFLCLHVQQTLVLLCP